MQELRTSERKTWGDCPQQWWWSYVEELAPIRKANALWFGALWHDAMALWYLQGKHRGPHPAETLEKTINQHRRIFVNSEEEEEEVIDARELGIAMGIGYVDKYGNDEQWDILAIEKTAALIFRRDGEPFLRYLLTIDGLYRDLETGEIFILEHKTAKAVKIGHLRLDNQAGSYYAAAPYVLPLAKLLKPGERIAGIQYNYARKAKPDERPVNSRGMYTNKPTKAHYVAALAGRVQTARVGQLLGEVALSRFSLDDLTMLAAEHGIIVLGEESKTQPAPYFVRPDPVYRTPAEQETQLLRIQDEAFYMNQMRTGALPVIKTPGEHCNWCPFKEMCELDEYDQDAAEGFKQARMIHRDPYEQYRKVA